MASSSAKHISPLFFFLFLLQIHARESHFFSKTTRGPPTEAFAPSNPHKETATTLTPQTHTNNNGYGLYGRDPDPDHFSTNTMTAHGTYNYNGGRGHHPTESKEFENLQVDPSTQNYYNAYTDERNRYPNTSSSRWKANNNAEEKGVYNYNGGRSGGYYGFRNGFRHNKAMEDEYQTSNQETEENQEEFTP